MHAFGAVSIYWCHREVFPGVNWFPDTDGCPGQQFFQCQSLNNVAVVNSVARGNCCLPFLHTGHGPLETSDGQLLIIDDIITIFIIIVIITFIIIFISVITIISPASCNKSDHGSFKAPA